MSIYPCWKYFLNSRPHHDGEVGANIDIEVKVENIENISYIQGLIMMVEVGAEGRGGEGAK